jgi:aerobic-type carbon monoxide dehydrogenase small subunit (CoxS/CutS family)
MMRGGGKLTEDLLVKINVNGKIHEDKIPSGLKLIDYLREYCGLTGTKKSCGEGECGACSVLVDGRLVYSCIMFAVQADGKKIVTIEGLGMDGELHPIQQAFIEAGAIQCGFCTPGMVLATKALLDRTTDPSEQQIYEALSGNLCRCTGYTKIIDAVKNAAKKMRSEGLSTS